MAAKNFQRIGDTAFSKMEKINSEVLSLTYGAIVTQLLKDYEDVEEVSKQLDRMGYNIGQRLIDEMLAKSNLAACADFRETAEAISKVGFKMFLGVTAQTTNWNAEGNEFSLILEENPLNDFVELPEQYRELKYSNILCGVIRGALEMVNMKVECTFLRCVLSGDDACEIRVVLIEKVEDKYPFGED